MNGAPIAQLPRLVLKKLVEAARPMRVKTGVEAEFFLLNSDGGPSPTFMMQPRSLAMTSRH